MLTVILLFGQQRPCGTSAVKICRRQLFPSRMNPPENLAPRLTGFRALFHPPQFVEGCAKLSLYRFVNLTSNRLSLSPGCECHWTCFPEEPFASSRRTSTKYNGAHATEKEPTGYQL
ncbi:hypothetical protein GYMLUDRAFT_735970 [Collybiopsis luxurians FD-317 M1]|uniref:Uncharacterized protein n=1 Tax=Collybiopsis luxurians FD-317 M1 TaxID=944289 RepID=A0A0D0C5P9_9AGAR|nr:hypothetical protein GYMLUDRAFT_735970 [Collybiopsis luxurians FD-317 M1]